ncbi:MAG: mechanosensitive ion channel [Chitinophagaceae bacterium]|nr:mechanosensitive ion channel [Chitinophagaceae bacterium]
MKEILNYTLIEVGDYKLKLASVLMVCIIALVSFLTLLIIKKLIYKSRRIETGKKYSFYNLIKYFVLVIALVLSLQTVGFNVSVLLAGSAALLVGIGLGLQNLFSDFISGIVLLIDATIKVNDIIEVNGMVCKVKEIKLRTTTVLTRDDKSIILPNTILTKNQIINWTHSEVDSRFDIQVGVDYSSDVTLAMEILKQAVLQQKDVLKEPKPFVRFTDYADSSLLLTVYFWTNEVFRVENVKSEIRVRIFQMFKENNITIPFPQRVVHTRP